MKLAVFFPFLVLCIAVLQSGCTSKIDNIHIIGKVDSIDGTVVRIKSTNGQITYDSTIVKNNQFAFNSSVPEEGFYTILFHSKEPFKQKGIPMGGWLRPCPVYLEKNSNYEFTASGKYEILQGQYSINSSSLVQQKLNLYHQIADNKRKKYREIKISYLQKADDYLKEGNDELYKKYTALTLVAEEKERLANAEAIHEFIKENPNTLITPYLITKMSDFFENYALYKRVLDGLSPDVKKTEYAKKVKALLKATENLRIGGDVPQIYGSDVNGKPFDYDYTKNKYTLIDLWASWCLPCRYQTPQLKTIYKRYKNKGFDIVAVSVDERKDWWTETSKWDKIPWYNVSELVDSKESKNVENFVAKRLPLNYLVDNQGKIIGKELELDSLEKFLDIALQ